MKLPLQFLFFSLLFVACSHKNKESADYAVASESADLASPRSNTSYKVEAGTASGNSGDMSAPAPVSKPATEKKIIKNANLRFEVKSHDQSLKNVERVVKQFGGYITNSTQTNSSYSIQSNLTIRVNANKLDTLISKLVEESINLEQKSINAEDVTAQYIDAEARLKSKRELENRYLEILKGAKNVKDILEIEGQLNIIREEIEAKEGVLKYYNDQVALSTVNLTIFEKTHGTAPYQEGFFSKILSGLLSGWNLLLDFIVGLFRVWPFVLIAVLLVVWFRRWRKKRRSKSE